MGDCLKESGVDPNSVSTGIEEIDIHHAAKVELSGRGRRLADIAMPGLRPQTASASAAAALTRENGILARGSGSKSFGSSRRALKTTFDDYLDCVDELSGCSTTEITKLAGVDKHVMAFYSHTALVKTSCSGSAFIPIECPVDFFKTEITFIFGNLDAAEVSYGAV